MMWSPISTTPILGVGCNIMRRWIQDGTQRRDVLKGFQPMQRREASTLMLGLIESTENYEAYIKR